MTQATILFLTRIAVSEKISTVELESSELAQTKNEFLQQKLAALKEIGESRNLEDIIAAEKFLVQYDLKEYANSKEMVSSLNDALENLKAVETHLGLLAEPDGYQRFVNMAFEQHTMRDSRDLPKDGARQAFLSHDTRLRNNDRSKSNDLEKAINHARLQNIRIAKNLYIERQQQVLSEPENAAIENEGCHP
jgi:hypothetical protein